MIEAEDLLLLDTNILIHLIRGRELGRRINTELNLAERPERPVVSIVTVGELHAFALKLGWGSRKISTLHDLVRQLVILDIHSEDVVNQYAAIDHYSEKVVKPARPLGQNDMWIAACGAAYGAHLVTTDKDFDHLTPRFLPRTRIDPAGGVTHHS